MMFDVNISSVRVPRSIIAFRSKIQTGPILEKGFDIDQDRFHITCRIPMWQFYNFDGCDSEHHWTLQPWSNDLDQRREERVQVHGEVQLKLYVIISKSWFQFFKILFQQAEKMKTMLCAFNVKQIPNYKELHLLWVGKTTKLHIPLENTIVNCISTDSSFRSRLHNWHQIINEDARCSIGAENLKHQITIRLNVMVVKGAPITLNRDTLLLSTQFCFVIKKYFQ